MTTEANIAERAAAGAAGAGLAALALLLLASGSLDAQELSYSAGRTVSPAYEGWVERPDGSRAFLFGYMNRNWEERLDVPVGPDNYFATTEPGGLDDLEVDAYEPGSADRGQPTHFLPRRNRFVFEVPVPEGFDAEDELVWTLVSRGETKRAYASMRDDYFLDNVTIMSETGSLGAGTSSPEIRANEPPTVELEGPPERRVAVGEPLTLAVEVTDDGVPPRDTTRSLPVTEEGELDLEEATRKPYYITVNKVNALHHSWFVYRQPAGAGVTFEPPQIKVWEDVRPWTNSPWAEYWAPPEPPEDDRWVARAIFDEPGTYLLRGRADDGGLWTDVDVSVRVTP